MRRRRLWSIVFDGVAAFVGRHRVDDAEQPLHVLFGVDVAHRFGEVAHAGDQAHDFLQRAELRHLRELLAEVVERELAFAEPLLLPGHFVLVELLLRLFDQREHVALAEDAAGHAVGMEFLERVEMLADADELDRHAGHLLDREAAPPRASPSSLVMITPSSSSASLKTFALLTASCPVMPSTTR